jgi:subtilisin family serine protease
MGGSDGADKFTALLLKTMAMPATSSPMGAGVGIAIIDSGFDAASRDDFETKESKFYDFTTGSLNPKASPPYDNYGHGTHVAGLIGSGGKGSDGLYRGLASGARLIHLKVLDENGEGFDETYPEYIVSATGGTKEKNKDARYFRLSGQITSGRSPERARRSLTFDSRDSVRPSPSAADFSTDRDGLAWHRADVTPAVWVRAFVGGITCAVAYCFGGLEHFGSFS